MEHREEHTCGSSYNEQGAGASSLKLNWAPMPHSWGPKDQALIEKLDLTKFALTCKDMDESIVLEAITNYNEATRKTQVKGVTLELNAETMGHAFELLRETAKKHQNCWGVKPKWPSVVADRPPKTNSLTHLLFVVFTNSNVHTLWIIQGRYPSPVCVYFVSIVCVS